MSYSGANGAEQVAALGTARVGRWGESGTVQADGDLKPGEGASRSGCRGHTPAPARSRFHMFGLPVVWAVATFMVVVGHGSRAMATGVTFGQTSYSIDVKENTAPGSVIGTVVATDSDGDPVTHSVGGTDATAFQELFALNASTGEITVKTGATINYEVEKKSYSVTIMATDGEDDAGATQADPTTDATATVSVRIINVDEPGVVTFSTTSPQVGVELRVTLSDPDGRRGGFVSSYWERAVSENGPFYADLSDAEAHSGKRNYTPQEKDKYKYLRFTVWYMDQLCNRVSILDKSCFKKAVAVLPSRVRDENGLIVLSQTQNEPATGTVRVTKMRLLDNGTADSTDDALQVGNWVKAYVRRADVSDPNGVNSLRQFGTPLTYKWYRINTLTAAETELPPVYDEDGRLNTRFHTITDADLGKGLQARAFFLDDEGNRETLQSALHYVPPPTNTPATGTPTITGTAEVGEELSVDTSGISDTNGIETSTMTYEWIRHDGATATTIDGATESTYTLVSDDQGKTITVKVSFRDGYGYAESRTSAATAAVAEAEVGGSAERAPNTAATGAPTITGTVEAGKTLTAGTKGISDANGMTNAVFSYQWIAADVDIDGATGASYSLATADEGKVIKVRVSFTDDAGNAESVTSAATSAVAATTGPTATFENVPANHNGGDSFRVDMRFSQTPNGLSYRTVGGSMLEVTGGRVNGADRITAGSNIAWRIQVTPSGLDAMTITLPVRACTETNAVCFGTTPLAVAAVVTIPGPLEAISLPDTPDPETARFSALPESHDGSTPFTLELRFSQEPQDLSYTTVGGALLEVTGARVTGARRLTSGSNIGWEVTVEPSQSGDIEIRLPNRACGETNAICINGQALSEAVSATVPHEEATETTEEATETAEEATETTEEVAQLTAAFGSAPSSHNGSTAFSVQLRFSEEVDLSYTAFTNGLLTVTGGSVKNARRLQPPSNIGWEITVTPSGNGEVVLTLPANRACDVSPTVCTSDGRQLAQAASVTVPGPGSSKAVVAPLRLALDANYPNPFNTETQIAYTVPAAGRVALVIYNVLGQRERTLVEGLQSAGRYQVAWDGRNEVGAPVTSGVYFYRLTSEQGVLVRRLLLLK